MRIRVYVARMTLTFMLGLSLTVAAATVRAEDNVNLKKDMSAAEFEAAGLNKLTSKELANLQAWLQGRGISPAAPDVDIARRATPAAPRAPAAASNPEAEFGKEQIRRKPDPEANLPESVTARVQGEFRGWDGTTIFRLDNGQVWQQRVGGKWRSPRRVDPVVVIEKGRFGYYLSPEGTRRSVGVKRLK